MWPLLPVAVAPELSPRGAAAPVQLRCRRSLAQCFCPKQRCTGLVVVNRCRLFPELEQPWRFATLVQQCCRASPPSQHWSNGCTNIFRNAAVLVPQHNFGSLRHSEFCSIFHFARCSA